MSTPAKKPLHIHFTKKDEDWLQALRKEQAAKGKGKKALPSKHAHILAIVGRFKKSKAKSEADPHWDTWIDETQEGGKKKVPNPNAESRTTYPEVEFSTALKDKTFRDKAVKEFHAWLGKKTKTLTAPEEKPKSEPKAEPGKVLSEGIPKGFAITDADIEAAAKKHAAEFDEIVAEGKKKLKKYDYADADHDRGNTAIREWNELSEAEKLIHVIGHKIGRKFEASLNGLDRELHDDFYENWRGSSSTSSSFEMMGAVSSMGVKGHMAPDDADDEDYSGRQGSYNHGKTNYHLKEYAKEAYLYQQAFFKHLGIKELTIYRGMHRFESVPPKDGEKVGITVRELSSFTTDPQVAFNFGRPLKFKVPVAQVFGSNLVNPGIGSDVNASSDGGESMGEAEIIVMGGSSLTGELVDRKKKDNDEQGKKKSPSALTESQKKELLGGFYEGNLHKEMAASHIKSMLDKTDRKEYNAFLKEVADDNDLNTLETEKELMYEAYKQFTHDDPEHFSQEKIDRVKNYYLVLEDAVGLKKKTTTEPKPKPKKTPLTKEQQQMLGSSYQGGLHKPLLLAPLKALRAKPDRTEYNALIQKIAEGDDLDTLESERNLTLKTYDTVDADSGHYSLEDVANVNEYFLALDSAVDIKMMHHQKVAPHSKKKKTARVLARFRSSVLCRG